MENIEFKDVTVLCKDYLQDLNKGQKITAYYRRYTAIGNYTAIACQYNDVLQDKRIYYEYCACAICEASRKAIFAHNHDALKNDVEIQEYKGYYPEAFIINDVTEISYGDTKPVFNSDNPDFNNSIFIFFIFLFILFLVWAQ